MVVRQIKQYVITEEGGENLTEEKLIDYLVGEQVMEIKKINELPQIFEVKTTIGI